jgi:dCMP deaminase
MTKLELNHSFIFKRPTRDDIGMAIAEVMALRGTCSRKQVGVAIAREGRILSTGYNSAPAGMPHCSHECTRSCFEHGRIRHFSECAANPENVCNVTIHAELNAIVWAARHGISLDQATMFTTYSSCLNCAKAVINAGISEYYYLERYHDVEGLELIRSAKIQIFDMSAQVVID